MSNEPLDKHFRDQLRGYQSPVDSEAIWQAVQPARPRRRLLLWWFLGGLALLLGGGFIAWQSGLWAPQPEAVAVSTTPAAAELANSGSTPTTAEARSAITPDLEQAPATAAGHDLTAHSVEKTTVGSAGSSVTVPAGQATGRDNAAGIAGPVATTSLSPAPTAGTSNAATGSADLTSLNPEAPATNAATPTEVMATAAAASALTTEKSATDPDVASLLRTPSVATPLRSSAIKLLPQPTVDLARLKDLATAAPPAGRRRGPSPWFLQADVALYANTFELTSTSDSIYSDWAGHRKHSEQTLEAWSTTFGVGYQHPTGWYARTGLSYTQWASRFELRRQENRTDTVQGITAIYITPAGDSSFVEGPIARYEQISYYKRTYNYLRHWDIPLLVGYQLRQGYWRFGLEGGIRFNFRQEAIGEILSPDLEVAKWSEAGQLRTSVGISWQAGATVGYQLTPKLQLQLGAQLRYYPQSFTEEGSLLISRRQLLGGQLGFRWNW